MAVTNADDIYMAAPEYGLDNIVAIYTGSISLAAPAGPGTFTLGTNTHNTGFNENCYLQGIFNVNSGTVFNDLGVYTPAGAQFQTQTVRAFVTSAGVLTVVGINWYNIVAGSGAPATVAYKIALLAKNTQGNITPTGTNEILYFNSAYNYQKIFMEGSVASPTVGNVTINHNLGYVPKARGWYSPSANVVTSDIGYTLPAGCMATLDWMTGVGTGQEQITTTTLVFSPMSTTVAGTLDYRIYLDA